MADNGPRELAQKIRDLTNGGVDIIRSMAKLHREATNKRDSEAAAKLLRERGFDPETVESLSDDEIKRRMGTPPPKSSK